MDDAQVRAALSARGIDLDDLIARIDAESVWYPEAETVAAVIVNPTSDPFDGVARLEVDFSTHSIRPIEVYGSDGEMTNWRIVDETIGPVGANHRRRWRFGLEFLARVPADSAIVYALSWATEAPDGESAGWPYGAHPPLLPAYETDCHPGDLSNPVALAEVSAHPESQ